MRRRLSYVLLLSLLAVAGSIHRQVSGYCFVAPSPSSAVRRDPSTTTTTTARHHHPQHQQQHRRQRPWCGGSLLVRATPTSGWSTAATDGRLRSTTVRSHPQDSEPTAAAAEAAAVEARESSVLVASSHDGSLGSTEPSTVQATSSSSSIAFFDQVVLHVRAGSGGAGMTSFEINNAGGSRGGGGSGSQGAPHGGNGGRGGRVLAHVDPHLNTLAGLVAASATRKGGGGSGVGGGELYLRAEHGHPGQRRYKPGNAGKDCVIRVPPGTIVEELVGADHRNWTQIPSSELQWVEVTRLGRVEEPSDGEDWDDPQTGIEPPSSRQVWEPVVLAEGGRGGDGNGILARSNQRNGQSHLASRPREGPTAGDRKTLRLTLQFLADVAVIGVPNAGKSTFLSAVTRAKPKIANYPFTTVIPNLGVWHDEEAFPDESWDPSVDDAGSTPRPSRLVLCDVPGLIDGASLGVGLGHAFLRHAELCHALVHVVDASSPHAVHDYELVNGELIKYSPALASKPQVVLLNKIDAFHDNPHALQLLQEQLRHAMPHSRLLTMSAKDGIGVDNVMRRLATFVQKVRAQQAAPP